MIFSRNIPKRRVVVTGMSCISPIGNDWVSVKKSLIEGISGIKHMDNWENISGLNTHVAAPACEYELDSSVFSRKKTRSMGKVAIMAVKTSIEALTQASLIDDPIIQTSDVGIAYGSSAGQPQAVAELAHLILTNSCRGITATTYVRMMSHTAAVNIGVFFGCKGRIIPTSSACTSGSQAIGYAYEAICAGKEKIMIVGGSEELHATDAAIFDTLFATSTKFNNDPSHTPKPFDANRDGLVVGEGAGTLILEDLEHAVNRGATIYAEVMGFGTNSDGAHITTPQSEQMAQAMLLALNDASLSPSQIDYINGHGTATDRGDIAESIATFSVFGSNTPYSTYKGHMGHTLGACGALEAIFSIWAMNENFIAPTLNLKTKDSNCANLDYVMEKPRLKEQNFIMSNNFAFGGINTSLIFGKWNGS